MTGKTEAQELLKLIGCTPDRFGNYVFKGKVKTFRIKLMEKAFRMEVKSGATWSNISPDSKVLYYSKFNSKLISIVNMMNQLKDKENK